MPLRPGSADEADRQARRFLIAAGTADYSYLPESALPSVRVDLRRIVDLFTQKLGYQRVLSELGDNPTSGALIEKVSDWLRDKDRQASDVIVFYYSGHGSVEGQKHYLLTSNSRENNLVGTALPTESLAHMLFKTPIQQFLVLLDACYSGRGAGDFSAIAAEAVSTIGRVEGLPSGIYAIAASRPKEEANQGAFAEAFVRVVENPPGPYAGNRPAYLDLAPLVASINEKLKGRSERQHASLYSCGAEMIPVFLPNLAHAEVADGTDIETQRRLVRAYRQDLISHWGPWRPRGGDRSAARLVLHRADRGSGRIGAVADVP